MRTCKKYEDLFLKALYDDLDDKERNQFHNHLKGCEACKLRYNRYKATLQIMDRKQDQELPQEYWDSYWDRLLDKMETPEKETMRWIPKNKKFKIIIPLPSWSYKVGFALGVLVIGIFLGRTIFSPSSDILQERMSSKQKYNTLASLDARTNKFLEKSRILLLGIINYDPDTDERSSFNLEGNREISQQLVQDVYSLQEDLEQTSQNKLSRLVEELELILLQIANLESEEDIAQIEMIQSGVEQKSILMKITINEMKKGYDLKVDTKEQKQKTI